MAAFRRIDPIQMQWPWRELGGLQPGMGAGCEGGRCGFLLPALRISTKDTKGHEGKRRRRPQGDDRKSGPRTSAGVDWEQGRSSLQPVCCAPSFVQFTVSEPDPEEIMAAFRRFDTIQMRLPWRWGRVQPGMGAGGEGGRCGFLLPALRISTKDTMGHEGKRRRRPQGDDRKSGPGTAAGAGCEREAMRIPFASFEDIHEGHNGARRKVRRRRPQGDDRKSGPCSAAGAGCEGGRCGFLLPALRISTKDTKGHEGKRRRRSQEDDRKSGPRTAAGTASEQGRSSLQPVCCAPSFVQFTVSEPDPEEIMAAFRCFDAIQMQLPRCEVCLPEWTSVVKWERTGDKGGDTGGTSVRSIVRFDDGSVRARGYGSLRESTRVCVSSREFA